MKLLIHNRFSQREQILFLIGFILLLYFPIYNAEICQVDDYTRLKGLAKMKDWSLERIFFPDSSKRLYYRPLISLTFIFDKYVLGLNTVLMHLENVLYHIFNTVLVFFLAVRISSCYPFTSRFLPFIVALLFGTTPLATEVVNLISGRTDLLACLFILLSTHCIFSFKETGRVVLLWLSFLSFLCAILSKETSIAFIPFAVLLVFFPKIKQDCDHEMSYKRKLIWLSSLTVLSLSAFGGLRYLASASTSGQIGLTIRIIMTNPEYVFFTWMRAFGFYVKKMFIPWPLNFAIHGVDPLFELLGMGLVPVCLYIFIRHFNSYLTLFLMASFLFFSPAFLISMNQIAWTPYADRYLYISMSFFTISIIFWLFKFYSKKRTLVIGLCAVIFVSFAVSTYNTNKIWKTNLTLFENAIQNSPYFRDIYSEYGMALMRVHRYQEAESALMHASTMLSRVFYSKTIDVNLAFVKFQLGKDQEAIALYEKVLGKKAKSHHALNGLVDIYTYKFHRSESEQEKELYYSKIVHYSERWFERKSKKFKIMYNLGKIALSLGKKGEALHYFEMARQACPETHAYYEICDNLINSLQVEDAAH